MIRSLFPILPKIVIYIALGVAVGLFAYKIKLNTEIVRWMDKPTPTPTWQEKPVLLTETETATMSGDFTKEYQTALEEEKITPRPKADQPLADAIMAGDLTMPTVTINGGPIEGAIISYPNPCFPLWVSDNMTPWQQLKTRSKLDTGQWSNWMNQFSYCFNNLGNGGHTVSIQIKDLAGNVSSEVKRTFIVKR